MERDIDLHGRPVRRLTLLVEGAHPFDRIDRRRQRLAAEAVGFMGVGVEGSQQAVAEELQNLSAARLDRLDHALEIGIQHVADLVARHGVADRREAAQIGQPDDRRQHIHHARPDIAGKDPQAAFMADIGVEHGDRYLARQADIKRQGEPGEQAVEGIQVAGLETARPVGRPGRHHPRRVGLDVGDIELDGAGEIVGQALIPQFLEDGKFERFIGVGERVAQGIDIVFDHVEKRALFPGHGPGRIIAEQTGLGILSGPPQHVERRDAGVQGTHADIGAGQGNTGRDEARAKAADQGLEVGGAQTPLDQPVADCLNLGVVDDFVRVQFSIPFMGPFCETVGLRHCTIDKD